MRIVSQGRTADQGEDAFQNRPSARLRHPDHPREGRTPDASELLPQERIQPVFLGPPVTPLPTLGPPVKRLPIRPSPPSI